MMEQKEQNLQRARRNARSELGFFIHATAFSLLKLSLFAVNLWSRLSDDWAVFPFFGWGLGLLIHGVAVFAPFYRLISTTFRTGVGARFQVPDRQAKSLSFAQ
jgi:hypothetical protein